MLIKANQKYVDRVENSKHFLNCPTHMLNYTLDCIYRQFDDENEIIRIIAGYLNGYGYKQVRKLASDFYYWRKSLTMKEFDAINVNPYLENTPQHIIDMSNLQSEWIDKHTTYYPFSGIIKHIPSYPYRYQNL